MHGVELWRSDGTAAGTTLVADVRPGLDSSHPSMVVAVGDAVFFWADDGVVGGELWTSDGSPGGTYLVADLVAPGGIARAGTAAAVGGRLVFGYSASLPGLWASDGSGAGTVQIADAQPWQQSFYRGAPFLALNDDLLLFAGWTEADGTGLWRTDGTAAGTVQLMAFDGSAPYSFERVGSEIFFLATVAGEPTLWRSDGTAPGTQQVVLPADVVPRLNYGRHAATATHLFFAAEDPDHGQELWVTDGVTSSMVKDVRPGPEGSIPFDFAGRTLFTTVGGRLVFSADDGSHGVELWASDGTESATQLLTELAPGGASVWLDALQLVGVPPRVGDDLLLRDFSADFGHRLWRTDGTPAGTSLVEVINDQTSAFRPPTPGWWLYAVLPPTCLTAAGGRLLLGADDGFVGWEPWSSDGTESGTILLADLAAPGPGDPLFPTFGSSPRGCQGVGGRGVFEASTASSGTPSLWGVDPGVVAAAEEIAAPFPSFWYGPAAVRSGGSLYLADGSLQVVRTDGTASGTEVVSPGTDLYSGQPELAATDTTLFVTNGFGLVTGALTGGSMASLTYDGVELGSVSGLGRLGASVLFAADHPTHPAELWRTDGTVAGTEPLTEVHAGPANGVVRDFLDRPWVAVTADRYVFVGDDGVHGAELWSSDGTPEGTAMVKDLALGPYPSSPRELVAFDGKVFFVAEATGLGRELWVTDGTESGTVLVADIVPGEGSSLPQNLAVADGKLYFSAWDPLHGREAWRVLPASAPPRGSVVEANVSGTAPTPPSIERLPDIALGARSSSPLRFAAVGGTVYTLASDNVRGFELWKIEEAGLIFRDGFESEDTEHWNDVEP